MAAETAPIREKTRRVKDHILNRFLTLSDKVDKEELLEAHETMLYYKLMEVFAKSVLPRTQEVTGEEGQAIVLSFDPSFKKSLDGNTSETEGSSREPSPF